MIFFFEIRLYPWQSADLVPVDRDIRAGVPVAIHLPHEFTMLHLRLVLQTEQAECLGA